MVALSGMSLVAPNTPCCTQFCAQSDDWSYIKPRTRLTMSFWQKSIDGSIKVKRWIEDMI